MNKLDLSRPPECFQDYLGETDPEKQVFWVCRGTLRLQRRCWFRKPIPVSVEHNWTVVCYTKEDAESNATVPHEKWSWDGEPATAAPLSEIMFQARRKKRMGVVVEGFDHETKTWLVLKEYPADQPLRGGGE